jgi:hypothetical protein
VTRFLTQSLGFGSDLVLFIPYLPTLPQKRWKSLRKQRETAPSRKQTIPVEREKPKIPEEEEDQDENINRESEMGTKKKKKKLQLQEGVGKGMNR